MSVPEIGPLLGRLADTAESRARNGRVPLDDIRFALVTALFELSGAAREFAAAGDLAAATASLGRHEWLAAWERAVSAVSDRIADRLNRRLEAAAGESRLPRKRLARLLLDDEERRAIGVRLGVCGGPFVGALDLLERTLPGASRNAAGLAQWQDALGAVSRKLEASWLALEGAADEEEAAWGAEVERVRSWRRPLWPLWIASAVALALAVYFGLLLGGFIPVPRVLVPMANFWWRVV